MKNNKLKELIRSQYNVNVAFYIHLGEYSNKVREDLEKEISEVFFFSRGVDWKFDNFGVEETGERKANILGYFIFRSVEVEKLKKLFLKEFKSYENALKISCSVAEYEETQEDFFELDV